jgi:hypothetical protein
VIDDALKFGTALPASMKPVLQRMIDLGTLTDESGKKISDLSGFTWDDSESPLQKGLGDLTKSINDLIGTLKHVPDAAKDAANGVPSNPFADWQIPDQNFPGAIPEAYGGVGRVTKPTLFLAGERGAEDFAFSGGGKSFGGGGGGATNLEATFVLDGRTIGRSVLSYLSGQTRLRQKLAPA